MQFNKRPLKSIVNTEALAYAMYTVEDRAIPHLVDGLKPVQRFFLYSTMLNAKSNFNKVAALAGRVSEFGYHHGEGSAASAGQLMANTWNNNMPIIQGRGNFGSRMVQDMAAPRYTFCKLHDNFFKVFKDSDIAPAHHDEEHIPPAYYLPTIPFVLLNGVKGIATGFATDILPHCPQDVKRCVKEYIETGNITEEPLVKFPEFNGNIRIGTEKSFIEGVYNLVSKTKLIIAEIPYKFEREAYVAILDDLEDKGIIVRYDDNCGEDNFNFEVTLKRDFCTDSDELNHEKIMKLFKLRQGISQNITVIDWNRKLREYDKASDLIKDFVDYRIKFTENRIDNKINEVQRKYDLAVSKVEFIEKVISEEIVLKGKTRAQAIKAIELHDNLKLFSENLIAMNIYHLTNDEISKLKKDMAKYKKELKYWKTTTVKAEYLKDLEEI